MFQAGSASNQRKLARGVDGGFGNHRLGSKTRTAPSSLGGPLNGGDPIAGRRRFARAGLKNRNQRSISGFQPPQGVTEHPRGCQRWQLPTRPVSEGTRSTQETTRIASSACRPPGRPGRQRRLQEPAHEPRETTRPETQCGCRSKGFPLVRCARATRLCADEEGSDSARSSSELGSAVQGRGDTTAAGKPATSYGSGFNRPERLVVAGGPCDGRLPGNRFSARRTHQDAAEQEKQGGSGGRETVRL